MSTRIKKIIKALRNHSKIVCPYAECDVWHPRDELVEYCMGHALQGHNFLHFRYMLHINDKIDEHVDMEELVSILETHGQKLIDSGIDNAYIKGDGYERDRSERNVATGENGIVAD